MKAHFTFFLLLVSLSLLQVLAFPTSRRPEELDEKQVEAERSIVYNVVKYAQTEFTRILHLLEDLPYAKQALDDCDVRGVILRAGERLEGLQGDVEDLGILSAELETVKAAVYGAMDKVAVPPSLNPVSPALEDLEMLVGVLTDAVESY